MTMITVLPKFTRTDYLIKHARINHLTHLAAEYAISQRRRLHNSRAGRYILENMGEDTSKLTAIVQPLPPCEDISITNHRPLPQIQRKFEQGRRRPFQASEHVEEIEALRILDHEAIIYTDSDQDANATACAWYGAYSTT